MVISNRIRISIHLIFYYCESALIYMCYIQERGIWKKWQFSACHIGIPCVVGCIEMFVSKRFTSVTVGVSRHFICSGFMDGPVSYIEYLVVFSDSIIHK